MDASARLAFNMKVLKRHDPEIEDIIESASFVVLYSHEGEWTKTGIEGPMFLYRRSANPPYGFFILNRNGVENFSANLTVEDDLELSTEFIIYGASRGKDVVGIWIFEPAQRESVGQQMLRLQKTPITSTTPQPVSIASAARTNPTHMPSNQPASQGGKGISLDALFGTSSNIVPAAQPTALTSNGLSLLNSIFDSASPKPNSAKVSADPLQGAEGLKAMLGLSAPKDRPSTSLTENTGSAPGMENLLASTTISSPNPTKPSAPLSAITRQEDAQKAPGPPLAADVVHSALQAHARCGTTLPPALSRRDFVREILSLIHTDKGFVDDLYKRYQSHTF